MAVDNRLPIRTGEVSHELFAKSVEIDQIINQALCQHIWFDSIELAPGQWQFRIRAADNTRFVDILRSNLPQEQRVPRKSQWVRFTCTGQVLDIGRVVNRMVLSGFAIWYRPLTNELHQITVMTHAEYVFNTECGHYGVIVKSATRVYPQHILEDFNAPQ